MERVALSRFDFLSLLGAVLWALFIVSVGPNLIRITPEATGQNLHIWRYGWATAIYAGVSLALLGMYIRSVLRRRAWTRSLLCLPALGVPILFYPHISPVIASNLFLYGSPVVWAVAVADWLAGSQPRPPSARDIFLAATLAFAVHFATGWHMSSKVGPHAGDEGHYLAMAESLWRDGDLDLRNNLGYPDESQRDYMHISPLSPPDRWYSIHPFGLSILIAPFAGFGIWFAHLVMGLFSGAGSAILMAFMRWAALSRRIAWTVLATTVFGLYWGIYASRVWTDLPGAICALTMLAGMRPGTLPSRARAPLVALAVFAAHWFHVRFLALSAAGAGLFALWAVYDYLKSRDRAFLSGAAIVVVSFLVSFALSRWANLQLFGTTTSYGRVSEYLHPFNRYWIGLWQIIASSKGVTYSLPVLLFWPAAAFFALREERLRPLFVTALLLAGPYYLVISTVDWFDGGSSLPARFLVAIAFLWIPFLAILLERSTPPVRRAFLVCQLLPLLLFWLMMLRIEQYKKSFISPWHAIPVVEPWLEAPRIIYTYFAADKLHLTILLGFVAFTIAAAVQRRSRRLSAALLAGWFAGALALGSYPTHWRYPDDPIEVARKWRAVRPLKSFLLSTSPPATKIPLFEFANRLKAGKDAVLPVITTGAAYAEYHIALNKLTVPDWETRGFRWATIAPPFYDTPGLRYFRMRARFEGDARIRLLIRHGSSNLLEEELISDANGVIEWMTPVKLNDRGDIYLLCTLTDGSGRLTIERLDWSPDLDPYYDRVGVLRPSSPR